MWRRTLAVFLAFAGAGTAAADTIDVNVNNHVVEGRKSENLPLDPRHLHSGSLSGRGRFAPRAQRGYRVCR